MPRTHGASAHADGSWRLREGTQYSALGSEDTAEVQPGNRDKGVLYLHLPMLSAPIVLLDSSLYFYSLLGNMNSVHVVLAVLRSPSHT